ncbi:hypothetical protein MPLA_1830196 [Mesorhizobium sp. ORS 3359]|nr:hypothetical protein MPLA_1830196 [Mesorhizobium sp. ORS 3359]
MVAKDIPGQLIDFPMVLVGIELGMREHYVGIDARPHIDQPVFYRSAMDWEVAVLKIRDLDFGRARPLKEGLGRCLGFGRTGAAAAQHAPMDVELHS